MYCTCCRERGKRNEKKNKTKNEKKQSNENIKLTEKERLAEDIRLLYIKYFSYHFFY